MFLLLSSFTLVPLTPHAPDTPPLTAPDFGALPHRRCYSAPRRAQAALQPQHPLPLDPSPSGGVPHTGDWSDDRASMQRVCPRQLQRHQQQHKTRLEACSAAGDMYSLGVLLVEVATGSLPFPGGEARLSHSPDSATGDEDESALVSSMIQQMANPALVSCSCSPAALSGLAVSCLLVGVALQVCRAPAYA